MITTERETGRKYQIVKVFVKSGGRYMEASTLRSYNLVKRYI